MPPYSDELMAWCRTNLERARGLESQLVGHVVAHLTDPMSNPSPLAFSAEFPEEAHYIYELATCYGFNILPSSTETSAVYILGPTPEAMPKCSLVRAAHGGKRPAPVQSSEKFAHSMLRIDRKKASPSEAAPPVLVPRDSAGDYVVALPPRRRVHTTQFSMLGAEDDEESEARSAMSVVANLNNDDVCCVCLDPLLSLSRAKSGESLAFCTSHARKPSWALRALRRTFGVERHAPYAAPIHLTSRKSLSKCALLAVHWWHLPRQYRHQLQPSQRAVAVAKVGAALAPSLRQRGKRRTRCSTTTRCSSSSRPWVST